MDFTAEPAKFFRKARKGEALRAFLSAVLLRVSAGGFLVSRKAKDLRALSLRGIDKPFFAIFAWLSLCVLCVEKGATLVAERHASLYQIIIPDRCGNPPHACTAARPGPDSNGYPAEGFVRGLCGGVAMDGRHRCCMRVPGPMPQIVLLGTSKNP